MLAVLGGVALASTAGTRYVQGQELGSEIGSQLAASFSPVGGASQELSVNGERFKVVTRLVQEDVATVLAVTEEACERQQAGLTGEFGTWLGGLRAASGNVDNGERPRLLTQRSSSETATKKGGEVVCWARSDHERKRGLAESVRHFLQTGFLSSFGHFRYVRAERASGAKSTAVFAVWSEGKLDLAAWFPETGDAPGADIPAVPRPEGSQRIFSAGVNGAGRQVAAYESTRSATALAREYETRMTRLDWKKVVLDEEVGVEAKLARAFTKDDGVLFVALTPSGDKTGVTLIRVTELQRHP